MLIFGTMLSAAKIKIVRSLSMKKHRIESGLFLAEGPKLVSDLAGHFHCELLIATDSWAGTAECKAVRAGQTIMATEDELRKASLMQAPQKVIALFRIPETVCDISVAEKELCLALDGIQDPGNLGTIVRIADWFGIGHIFCSHETADIYNPKSVQATMGAMGRVSVHYVDLCSGLSSLSPGTPVYGTYMDGKSIYGEALTANGIIVMGNEGSGISPAVGKAVTSRICIPSYPVGRPTSESLNVASATAIVCSEFRRNTRSDSI